MDIILPRVSRPFGAANAAVPTQPVSPDFSSPDPTAPLTALANTAGLKVQALQNNTYYIYDPTQVH